MCSNKACTAEHWFKWYSVIMLTAALIVVVVSASMGADQNAISNFSIHADGETVPYGHVGDVDGFLSGQLKMNQNQKTIKWDFFYDRLATVYSIGIYGPRGTTTSDFGPVIIALCGPPSTTICDTTTPRKIIGEIDLLLPEHQSPREAITEIREDPASYLLCVLVQTAFAGKISVCSRLLT